MTVLSAPDAKGIVGVFGFTRGPEWQNTRGTAAPICGCGCIVRSGVSPLWDRSWRYFENVGLPLPPQWPTVTLRLASALELTLQYSLLGLSP